MMKKKILCLISDIGGAHFTIARVFKENLGSDFDFRILDLFKETSAFCSGSLRLYSRVLLNIPRFYNTFYEFNNKKILWNFVYRVFIARLMKDKTRKLLVEKKPSAVFCPFALTPRIAADCLEELGLRALVPLIVFVVDPFTVHTSWMEPRTDLYLVSSEKCMAALVREGVKEESIKLIKYPIGKRFGGEHNKMELRKSYGILESSRVILIMGGGEGIIHKDTISSKLLEESDGIHIIAVAGRNSNLYNRLKSESEKWKGRITVLGYSESIYELMALSDILITKPGPSTIMEAMQSELPMILTGFVPKQEEGNVDYIVSNGFGIYINQHDISKTCDYLFDDTWLEIVKSNMKNEKLSFPDISGFEEIRRIVEHSDESRFA